MQLGYNKFGAHARVFSQTLAHGNNKSEIRQRNRRQRKRGVGIETSKAGTNGRSPDDLNYSSALSIPLGSVRPRKWINYLAKVTYAYNTFTAPGGRNTIIINIVYYYYI